MSAAAIVAIAALAPCAGSASADPPPSGETAPAGDTAPVGEIAPAGEIVQISARLALGGGAGSAHARDPHGIFELALRADALFGDRIADRARIGPAIDVRTATFGSLELAGGVAGLVPLGSDFALTLTLGAGYALRDQGAELAPRHGGIALATLTASFRPYDHWDAYGYALGLYASGRAGFAGYEAWEITAGLEIDLELVLVAPIRFLATATQGGDPHEPLE